MPRVRRVAKRRNDYHPQEIKLLMDGVSLTTRFGAIHKGVGDWTGLREAWAELRDDLMEQWIAAYPFTRPWAWLVFDATEPRERTIGEQRMESQQAAKERAHGNYRLCYFQGLNRRLGAEDTRGNEGDWETERQYFCRLNLLTAAERELL